jgi:hypothetical protein
MNKTDLSKIIKAWEETPKGPAISEKELDQMRTHLCEKGPLDRIEQRKLLQYIDFLRTGVEYGILKEFPALGSTVYMEYHDCGLLITCSGIVIEHLSDGSIKIRGRHISKGEITETWYQWMSEDEFKDKYGSRKNDGD